MYARAYDVLSAAGSIAVYKYPGLVTDEDILAVRHRARRFAARELGKASASAPSVPRRRFISAVTCLGPVCQCFHILSFLRVHHGEWLHLMTAG